MHAKLDDARKFTVLLLDFHTGKFPLLTLAPLGTLQAPSHP
jgi:hypothetical protein